MRRYAHHVTTVKDVIVCPSTQANAQHIPLEQALNGAIAVLLFNLLYDVFLSQRLKWYAMCPVIDSINHDSASNNTVSYEYFRDTFVVAASSGVQQGQQVFITYGSQSNDSLLQV